MLNHHFNVITWTSELSEEDARRLVRSKASALGWKRRNPSFRSKHSRTSSRQHQREASIVDEIQAYARSRRIELPAQVTAYEPQSRFLPTFIPRFESLIGPDTKKILSLSHSNDLVQEAVDCLIVGVCSNLRFDAELRSSAVQRYGALLPKIQARVTNSKEAETSSTLSLIFLLGIQEALVWKSFGNSQTHIAGWGRVVEMCGPQFFTSPDTLFIFRMFRMNAVTLHLRQRKALFISSEDWMTIPCFCVEKDLFDLAYDLLVQIPNLLADVESVKEGRLAYAQMQANVGGFIRKLHWWRDENLFPRAAQFVPGESPWSIEKAVALIADGTIFDFSFARGLSHYFAAILLMANFGQRCVDTLPMHPEQAIRWIVMIVQKQAVENERGFLWPWFVPLRIAHFSGFATGVAELLPLCERLEREYYWPILQSERYMLYSQQKQ